MRQLEAPKTPKPHFLADGLPKVAKRWAKIGIGTGVMYKLATGMGGAIGRHNETVNAKVAGWQAAKDAAEHANTLKLESFEALKQFNNLHSIAQSNKGNEVIHIATENAKAAAESLDAATQKTFVEAINIQKVNGHEPRNIFEHGVNFVQNSWNFAKEASQAPLMWLGGVGHVVSSNPTMTAIVILAYSAAYEIGKLQKLADEYVAGPADYIDAFINIVKKTAIVSAGTVLVAAVLDKLLTQIGQNSIFEAMKQAWPVAGGFFATAVIIAGFAAAGKILLEKTMAGKERAKKTQAPLDEPPESDTGSELPAPLGGGSGIQA